MTSLNKTFLTCTLFTLAVSFTANSFADEPLNIKTSSEINNNIDPIVVTIKPLYSLVAHITDGVQTPELLIKQPPSSHHYQLRPSERQLLASAKLIVWFGPQMETYVAKIIQQEMESRSWKTQVISAMQSDGLRLFSNRTNQHSHPSTRTSQTARQKNIDPHVWLSSYNASVISKHIAQSLISLDPQNAAIYQNNLQRLLSKIEDTERKIKTILNSKSQPGQRKFISYHDAFQYFDRENQLEYIDSISYDEESSPSLKHIRQIKTLIDKKKIHCLVYQPPEPAIINTLTTRTHIQATALDPMGLNTGNNKDAWFELMLRIAEGFKQCLNP